MHLSCALSLPFLPFWFIPLQIKEQYHSCRDNVQMFVHPLGLKNPFGQVPVIVRPLQSWIRDINLSKSLRSMQHKLKIITLGLHFGNWWSKGTSLNVRDILSCSLFDVKDSQIRLWATLFVISNPLSATRLSGLVTSSEGRSLATAILDPGKF